MCWIQAFIELLWIWFALTSRESTKQRKKNAFDSKETSLTTTLSIKVNLAGRFWNYSEYNILIEYKK